MVHRNQRGQALLIVVFIMVVLFTVGLAMLSRSVVDVKTSTEEENSERALAAAEAAIERLQKLPVNSILSRTTIDTVYNTVFQSASSIPVGGQNEVVLNKPSGSGNPAPVSKDEGIDFLLSDGPPSYDNQWPSTSTGNRQIDVYWGKTGDACAALEVIVLSGDITSPNLEKHLYDPCDLISGSQDLTIPGGGTIDGVAFQNRTGGGSGQIRIDEREGIMMRIIPIFANTIIGLKANANTDLPIQGKSIVATGTSGNTQRKVQYYQSLSDQLPAELFNYVLFCTGANC